MVKVSYPKVIAFLFPPRCIGCDAWVENDAQEICPDCRDNLNFLTAPAHLPKLKTKYCNSVYSLLAYEEKVVGWISQFKYGRKFYIGRILGTQMAAMNLPWKSYDAILPVPLHWSRQALRGFNPAHILAHQIGTAHNIPRFPYLQRIKATPQQTKKTAEARLANVHGAFQTLGRFHKGRLLLIDDVVTTGATVNESARALKRAGALTVDVLTLARTL